MATKGYGYNEHRLKEFGWVKNKDGKYINNNTGTSWDFHGFDYKGINKYTKTRFDKQGLDWDGYDRFNTIPSKCIFEGLFKIYGIKYNHRGFDINGKRKNGKKYDKNGFDVYGFNKYGKHVYTKTKWDHDGYDAHGKDCLGYPRGYYETGAE